MEQNGTSASKVPGGIQSHYKIENVELHTTKAQIYLNNSFFHDLLGKPKISDRESSVFDVHGNVVSALEQTDKVCLGRFLQSNVRGAGEIYAGSDLIANKLANQAVEWRARDKQLRSFLKLFNLTQSLGTGASSALDFHATNTRCRAARCHGVGLVKPSGSQLPAAMDGRFRRDLGACHFPVKS